jgi:acyl-CoA dehydrogenase
VLPHGDAGTDDDARTFMTHLAAAGLLRWCVSPAGGGHASSSRAALDARSMAVIRDGLSHASGLADLCFIMQALGSLPISLAGSADQQQRFLPRVHGGQAITAFALTEPEAGSDVASLSTRAVRDGDSYVLTGHKKFISQAPLMDLMCIFARTSDQGARGITAFVVERGTPGITVRRQQPMAPHPLGEVLLDGVRVPAENRLGEEGQGMRLALRTLDVCRPTVAAAACGMARRALQESIQRARTRVQFGKPLWEHQLVGQKLAQMVTSLSAAQLLTARACHAVDGGGDATFHVSQAKLHATEAAGRITDDAIQVFGGDGVLQGSVVERLYREVRALRIYEGTSEIQHLVIARALMKD